MNSHRMCPDHPLSKMKKLLPDVLIFFMAAVLLFSSLDSSLLWQDEAETALLGKNILEFGVPKAYDGKNVISQETGREYGDDYVWRWTSWGDKYVAALSMRFFGETTAGARFLFVGLGFLSIFFFHLTAARLFPSSWTARLATLFYVTSVPFLLHVRQCRYYSLVLCCAVLMLYFILRYDRTRRHWVGFAAASFLLFHSNYFLCIVTLCSFLGTVFLVRLVKPFRLKEFVVGILAAMLISFPGMFFYRSYGLSERFRWDTFLRNLSYYVSQINDFIYPLLLAAFVAVLLIIIGKKELKYSLCREFMGSALLGWGAVYAAVFVLVLSFAPFGFFRYLTPLFPVAALLLTLSVSLLTGERKPATTVLSAFLIFSNLISVLPGYAAKWPPNRMERRSYLYDYLYELTHERKGPIGGIVEYLKKNAEPGDIVLATYGDLPIKFYTGLEVHGGLTGEDLSRLDLSRIRWIILRHYIVTIEPMKDGYVHQFIQRSFDAKDFTRIDLNVPDTMFENREDPGQHLYRKPEGVPNVIIYRRR